MAEDERYLILEEYRLYTEQKERFVDRSFNTNKFYFISVLVLFLVMFLTKNFSFAFGISSVLIFSAAGIAICFLWWINMDSYNFLIKIKLSDVIEKLEKKLPVHPYCDEYCAIQELKKKKRMFVFTGMQKTLAVFALLTFFVLFINELVPLFLKLFCL